MNFRTRDKEEPEINLIPFIDVLLVVLIFLMLSTTYSKYTELRLNLPVADAQAQRDYAHEMIVAVSSDGRYAIQGTPLSGRTVETIAAAMGETAHDKDTVVIITADAAAPHQAVINVMEAARRSGLSQITFATQSSAHASGQR